jgi:hypothetical protein
MTNSKIRKNLRLVACTLLLVVAVQRVESAVG